MFQVAADAEPAAIRCLHSSSAVEIREDMLGKSGTIVAYRDSNKRVQRDFLVLGSHLHHQSLFGGKSIFYGILHKLVDQQGGIRVSLVRGSMVW